MVRIEPLGLVPLIGAVITSPSFVSSSISGEDDASAKPRSAASMYPLNGAGLLIDNLWNMFAGSSANGPSQVLPKFS